MMVGAAVKAVVIGAALKVVYNERITFDADLPEKRTSPRSGRRNGRRQRAWAVGDGARACIPDP